MMRRILSDQGMAVPLYLGSQPNLLIFLFKFLGVVFAQKLWERRMAEPSQYF